MHNCIDCGNDGATTSIAGIGWFCEDCTGKLLRLRQFGFVATKTAQGVTYTTGKVAQADGRPPTPHCLTPYDPVEDDRCIQPGCTRRPVTSLGKRIPLCFDHLDAVRQALANIALSGN